MGREGSLRQPLTDLPDKTLAELEALAEEQRAALARDPQHPTAKLGDILWEIQKRQWRSEVWSYPRKPA
ncbi:MAG TPA: hypothetical protein VF898_02255 [Chloroflexota bacterium]